MRESARVDAARRYFAPEIETMPRAELDALQAEKLFGDLLPWAYDRSRLIRDTWDAAGVTPSSVAPSRSDALRPAVLAASAVPAAPRNIRREIPLFMSILSSAHGSAATRPALSFYFAQ